MIWNCKAPQYLFSKHLFSHILSWSTLGLQIFPYILVNGLFQETFSSQIWICLLNASGKCLYCCPERVLHAARFDNFSINSSTYLKYKKHAISKLFILILPIYAYEQHSIKKDVWIYQKPNTVHWLHSRVEGLCLDNNRRSEVEKSHMEMGKM